MKNHEMNSITYSGSKQHLLKLFLEGNEENIFLDFYVFLCEIVMHVIYLIVNVVRIRWRWRVVLGLEKM